MKIKFGLFLAIVLLLAATQRREACRLMKEERWRQQWQTAAVVLQQSLQRAPVPPSGRNGDTTIPVPVRQRAFAGKSTAAPANAYQDHVMVPNSGVALNTN